MTYNRIGMPVDWALWFAMGIIGAFALSGAIVLPLFLNERHRNLELRTRLALMAASVRPSEAFRNREREITRVVNYTTNELSGWTVDIRDDDEQTTR